MKLMRAAAVFVTQSVNITRLSKEIDRHVLVGKNWRTGAQLNETPSSAIFWVHDVIHSTFVELEITVGIPWE